MKRIVILVAVGIMCAPVAAQEINADLSSEVTRIFELKKSGQKSLDANNLDAAAQAYQQVLEAQSRLFGADNPETLETTRTLAGVCEKQEKWEDLYRLRESLLDSQRRVEGKVTEDTVWGAGMAAFSWGAVLYGKVDDPPKDLAGARDLIRRLRERSEPFDGLLTTENVLGMVAFWNEAWTEYRSGNPQQAIKSLEPGLKWFPQNPWGNMAMALFCWQAGEKDDARDWYLAACEANMESEGPDKEFDDMKHSATARIFADEPGPPETEPAQYMEVYDRLLAAYPQIVPLYARRGICGVRIGRMEQALVDFRKALELQPENAWNWYNLAITALHAGAKDEYKTTCQGMLGRFAASTNPFDRHLLIIVWSLAPNPEIDAAKMLEMANRPDRTDDSRVARVLYRCGQLDEALAQLASKPDGITLAQTEYARGHKLAAQRSLVQARPGIRAKRDPVSNCFTAAGSIIAFLEFEILFREAEGLIGEGIETYFDRFSQLLVGDWTATGTIPAEGNSEFLKSGDKFTMVGSFEIAAGGKAVVGTQKLTVVDRANVSSDCSVMIAWDPVDMAVRIIACWSDGAVEIGSLTSTDESGFRGDYTIRLPDGRQESAEIALELASNDKFSWVFKSGPNNGKILSSWQRTGSPTSGE